MLGSTIFEDFSGGDSGRARPDAKAVNAFRGTNVWNFEAGIGPRPAFQDLGVTGLPLQRLQCLNAITGSDGFIYLIFIYANKAVYRVGAVGSGFTSGLAATALGNMANTPHQSSNFGSTVYVCSLTGAGAAIDPVAGTVTDIAAMPAGLSIVRYGQQAVVATTTGRVRFSALEDFTSWPAPNDIPVGASPQAITNLYVRRGALVVPKIEGDIWEFTGVLGVNENLRCIDRGLRHRFTREATGAVVSQSSLWFCGTKEMIWYTGAQAINVPRPDVPLRTGYVVSPWDRHLGTVAPMAGDNEFLLVGTIDTVASQNTKNLWAQAYRANVDRWTRHVIPATDYIFTGLNPSAHTAAAVLVNDTIHDGMVFIATCSDTAGNGGTASQVYMFDSGQEMPLLPTSTQYAANHRVHTLFDGKSGVPAVATFQAPEHWSDTGTLLTVRSVIIDYSYNPDFTPFSTYNRFDVSVEALQVAGSVTVRRSPVQAFTPPASGSTPDGAPLVRGQARFQVGDQGAGVGFRVRLDDWRGIIVHRITAVVDEAPTRF